MEEESPAQRAPSWVEEARALHGAAWRERVARLLSFRPRELLAVGFIAGIVVLGAGVGFVRALPKGNAAAPVPSAPAIAASPPPSASEAPKIVVYVAGAVRSPGVYDFPAGSRIIDALKAAGGPAPGADLSQTNLAELLTDGERVYVPRRGETPPPVASAGGGAASGGSSGSNTSGKVNINTATAAELDAGLPGVGPVLAQRIVDYRTQHGPFHDVRDLLKVEGIGQKKFDALKDSATV
ncbi:MAG: helix-hairpin-helix domain-containing protein [Actinomycetota bacterium]|nr:ComEA family DNA-binding protein [Actinomycetota bacterium]